MSSIKAYVSELSARLPELEWKLKSLPVLPLPNQLPHGLFRERLEVTAQSFVDEIKSDLAILTQKANEQSAHYVAQRLSQKINVLVRFCQQNVIQNPKPQSLGFGVQSLSTRQQWLQGLHEEQSRLDRQRQALKSALLRVQTEQKIQSVLALQMELGEVERRYTQIGEKILSSS